VTFRRAKDAYILGYFRYDFFTVAVHYAALAREAAVKARWSASLPQKVGITCGSDQVEMHFPSHTKISGLYRRNKWRGQTVLVNGQRFPLSMNSLLDWLEREKIVTKWERKGLGIGSSMRNELSHVEHSTTDIPSPDKLRFVAGLVNKLAVRAPAVARGLCLCLFHFQISNFQFEIPPPNVYIPSKRAIKAKWLMF
jgi:hypothetical protein